MRTSSNRTEHKAVQTRHDKTTTKNIREAKRKYVLYARYALRAQPTPYILFELLEVYCITRMIGTCSAIYADISGEKYFFHVSKD